MAQPLTVFLAWLAAVAYFSLLGWPLARWLRPRWAPSSSLAPALGWGAFSAASFAVHTIVGFNRLSNSLVLSLAVVAAVVWLLRGQRRQAKDAWPVWAFAVAATIAAVPMIGLLPKHADGGLIVGITAFDHSKIAMVDEMTRLGLPVGNPFFGLGGGRSTLPYYYLWHFVAAELSSVMGVSGWEADAAMTGVAAYSSLLLMMGLASRLRLSQATDPDPLRPANGAIVWTALLSLAGSLQPLLLLALGQRAMDRLWAPYRGLEAWMAQASWVPQHLASADCVVLAILILWDLSDNPRRIGSSLMAGALAASAFGASAWVGGVAFGAIALGVGGLGILRAKPDHRIGFVAATVCAALAATLLALPFLQAEFAALVVRRDGSAITFHPFEVVGPMVHAPLRGFLNLPAYWLALLPFDFPAIYPAGAAALIVCLRHGDGEPNGPSPLKAFAWMTLASLSVSWLLASTIGNNDLGWRAVLPAILILTPFAAAGIAHWIRRRMVLAAGAAVALLLASAPERLILENVNGHRTENAPDFAEAPAVWAAVRRHAGPADRVANNPGFLDDLTNWPVNPSWAMLSNRASCYSGWETARAYIAMPAPQIRMIDALFTRVFEGTGTQDDVHRMATVYGCRVAVVIQGDGAWEKDPFAKSPDYRLVEVNEDNWRIYRSTATAVAPTRGG